MSGNHKHRNSPRSAPGNMAEQLAAIRTAAEGAHGEAEQHICPRLDALLLAVQGIAEALAPLAVMTEAVKSIDGMAARLERIEAKVARVDGRLERVELHNVARFEDYPISQTGIVDLEERRRLLERRLTAVEEAANAR